MLSLLVGLWAVKVANREPNSKMYTYGVSYHLVHPCLVLVTQSNPRIRILVATRRDIGRIGQWRLPCRLVCLHLP